MERRRFLALTSALALTATAGCSDDGGDDSSGDGGDDSSGDGGDDSSGDGGDDSSGDGGDDSSGDGGGPVGGGQYDTPESVVRAFYDLQQNTDENTPASEILSQIQTLVLSTSPFTDLTEDDIDPGAEDANNIESVELAVVAEDLGAEELENRFNLVEFFQLSQAEVDAIVAENAVVEAQVQQSGESGVQTREHLVATENGEWLLFN